MKKLFLLGLVSAAVFPAAGMAQEFGGSPLLDYVVGLRAEYHDNLVRASGGDVDDTVVSPFVRFGLTRNSASLDSQVSGTIQYDNYLDDTFENEVRTSLSANFLGRLVEDRIHWVLQDNAAVATINQQGLINPANFQQTNQFSTGPDFIFRLGGVNRVTVGARYNNFYADQSDNDNDGFSLTGAWMRQLSPGRQFGLVLRSSSVDFDLVNAGNVDYDKDEIGLNYTSVRSGSGSTERLEANLGYSQVEFDRSGRGNADSPTLRVNWSRQNATGSFAVSLAREIGDFSSDLSTVVRGSSAPLVFDTAVSSDVFTRTAATARLRRNYGRFTMGANAFYDQLDYDTDLLDQDFYGIGATADFRLQPLLTLQAAASVSTRDYNDVPQSDDALNLSLGLNYQRTRHWSLSASANWADRDSSVGLVSADDFSFLASIQYRR